MSGEDAEKAEPVAPLQHTILLLFVGHFRTFTCSSKVFEIKFKEPLRFTYKKAISVLTELRPQRQAANAINSPSRSIYFLT